MHMGIALQMVQKQRVAWSTTCKKPANVLLACRRIRLYRFRLAREITGIGCRYAWGMSSNLHISQLNWKTIFVCDAILSIIRSPESLGQIQLCNYTEASQHLLDHNQEYWQDVQADHFQIIWTHACNTNHPYVSEQIFHKYSCTLYDEATQKLLHWARTYEASDLRRCLSIQMGQTSGALLHLQKTYSRGCRCWATAESRMHKHSNRHDHSLHFIVRPTGNCNCVNFLEALP